MPGESKAEMADKLDAISDLIDEALDSELSREEVIGKIKEMRDVVESEEEDEDLDADDDLDETEDNEDED